MNYTEDQCIRTSEAIFNLLPKCYQEKYISEGHVRPDHIVGRCNTGQSINAPANSNYLQPANNIPYKNQQTYAVENRVNYPPANYIRQIYSQFAYSTELLDKPDILRNCGFDLSGANSVYWVKKNNTAPITFIVFSGWKIDQINLLLYNKRYCKSNCIVARVGQTNVFITETDFNPKKVLRAFESKGLYPVMKDTESNLGQILMLYISCLMCNAQTMYIPYSSGWFMNFDGKLTHTLFKVNELGIDVPVFNNKLSRTNTNEPIKSCEIALDTLKIFNSPATRVFVLGSILYSLIYSLLRRVNIETDRFIVVEGNNNDLTREIVDFLYDIYNKKGYISLNNTPTVFKKTVSSYKDQPIIVDARGSDFKEYKQRENLLLIKDAVCLKAHINVNGSELNMEGLLLILSNELPYELPFSECRVLDITDVDMEYLKHITADDKSRWGDMLYNFISYVASVDLTEIIKSINFPIGTSQEQKAMVVSLSIFERFIQDKYKLILNDYIYDKGSIVDWHTGIYAYLSGDHEDTMSITQLFIDTIAEAICMKRLFIKKSREVSSSKKLDESIFIINDEIWLKRKVITNVISSMMNTEIKVNKLLRCLKKEGMLVSYRGEFRCKRVIYTPTGKDQEDFIVLKSDILMLSEILSKEVIKDETNEDNYWI